LIKLGSETDRHLGAKTISDKGLMVSHPLIMMHVGHRLDAMQEIRQLDALDAHLKISHLKIELTQTLNIFLKAVYRYLQIKEEGQVSHLIVIRPCWLTLKANMSQDK